MPSPFPGMDPFLEDHAGWKDFHTSLIPEIRKYLQPLVTPEFFVRIEEHVYITHPETDPGYSKLVPDVFITRPPRSGFSAAPRLGIATIKEPVVVADLLDLEIHDPYLEILDKRTHEVVTAIEVLSPANKVNSSEGREAMMRKRRELRQAGVHILEIDLLRGGFREARLARRDHYCVNLLLRGTSELLVWDIDLRDELPTVAVPLHDLTQPVPLELQKVFTYVYDSAMYDIITDYTRPVPPPMLRPEEAAWVEGRLKAWFQARGQAPSEG